MVTLIQTFKWLLAEKHIAGLESLKLKLPKIESAKPYCYRPVEIAAMVEQCQSSPRLNRLCGVVVAFATTGLRISELAKLKWSDIDRYFADGRLHSFRHAFVSTCANTDVPERIVMEWLGHKHSDMVRHYYYVHDEESRRQMDRLDPLGNKAGEQSPRQR